MGCFLQVSCYQRRLNNTGDWRPWAAGAKVAGDALLPLDGKGFKANKNQCGKKAGITIVTIVKQVSQLKS